MIAPKHAAGVVPVRVKTKSGKSESSRRARYTYVGGTSTVPALFGLDFSRTARCLLCHRCRSYS